MADKSDKNDKSDKSDKSDEAHNSETLLEELGGCGRFQISLVVYMQIAVMALIFTHQTNMYGMYNPGWRCLDNVTSTSNSSNVYLKSTHNLTLSTVRTGFQNSISVLPDINKTYLHNTSFLDEYNTNANSLNNTKKLTLLNDSSNYLNRTSLKLRPNTGNSISHKPSTSFLLNANRAITPNTTSLTLDSTSTSLHGSITNTDQHIADYSETKNEGRSEDLTKYGKHSCSAYATCKNVEFNPSTSTLITEWGMICDRKWMMSTMLMIANAGGLVSNFVVGYVGDKYGRKFPGLYARMLSAVILNFISIYSVSWAMYTTIHFFIGFLWPFEFLWRVLLFEFVPSSWRIRVISLPFWVFYSVIFSLAAMYLQDWKQLLLISTIIAAVTQIPGFWMPESLRWLIATGRKKQANEVIKTIAKINGKGVPKLDYVDILSRQNSQMNDKGITTKTYTFLDLFRKGYRLRTVVIAVIGFCMDSVYYTLHFTILVLPGNVYLNMMISALAELPANVIAFALASKWRRKPTYVTLFTLITICLLSIVVVNRLLTGQEYLYVNLGLVLLTKLFNYVKWMVMSTSITEMYPTVVRSNVNSFYRLASSVGGLVAPYMIPTDKESYYIAFLAMTALTGLCTCLSLLLPETKDVPLADTFPEEDEILDMKKTEKKKNTVI